MIRDLYTTENAKPLGNGFLSPAGSFREPELLKRVAGFKRAIAGRYSAISPEEIPSLPQGSLLVSPKIDGHFWCLLAEDGDVILVSPNGKVISGDLPLLAEAKKTVGKRGKGRVLCAAPVTPITAC